ncbi:MAG: DUF2683 family protein [Candidatus Parvarchaeum sp.]
MDRFFTYSKYLLSQSYSKIYIFSYDTIYCSVIMVKIQIDLSEEEDRIVEIYKLTNRFKTKQEAIKKMIKFFEAEVKPKKLNPNEYFK